MPDHLQTYLNLTSPHLTSWGDLTLLRRLHNAHSSLPVRMHGSVPTHRGGAAIAFISLVTTISTHVAGSIVLGWKSQELMVLPGSGQDIRLAFNNVTADMDPWRRLETP